MHFNSISSVPSVIILCVLLLSDSVSAAALVKRNRGGSSPSPSSRKSSYQPKRSSPSSSSSSRSPSPGSYPPSYKPKRPSPSPSPSPGKPYPPSPGKPYPPSPETPPGPQPAPPSRPRPRPPSPLPPTPDPSPDPSPDYETGAQPVPPSRPRSVPVGRPSNQPGVEFGLFPMGKKAKGDSPLIFDMDRNGMISVAKGMGVNMNAANPTIRNGAAVGGDKMLAMCDFSRNGEIDYREVFGDGTVNPFTGTPLKAANGFIALKEVALTAAKFNKDLLIVKQDHVDGVLVNVHQLRHALKRINCDLGFISEHNIHHLEPLGDVEWVQVSQYASTPNDESDGVVFAQKSWYLDSKGLRWGVDDVWFPAHVYFPVNNHGRCNLKPRGTHTREIRIFLEFPSFSSMTKTVSLVFIASFVLSALQAVTASLCSIDLSPSSYRERDEAGVFRELTLSVTVKKNLRNQNDVVKMEGAKLLITAFDNKQFPPKWEDRYRPAYTYQVPLDQFSSQNEFGVWAAFGPKQNIHFSYIFYMYPFKAEVVLKNGQVACKSKDAFDISFFRRSFKIDGKNDVVFFNDDREQPFTMEELEQLTEAVNNAEAMVSKEMANQPLNEPIVFQNDPKQAFNLLKTLRERADAILMKTAGEITGDSLTKVVIWNAYYRPLMRFGLPYLRYAAKITPRVLFMAFFHPLHLAISKFDEKEEFFVKLNREDIRRAYFPSRQIY